MVYNLCFDLMPVFFSPEFILLGYPVMLEHFYGNCTEPLSKGLLAVGMECGGCRWVPERKLHLAGLRKVGLERGKMWSEDGSQEEVTPQDRERWSAEIIPWVVSAKRSTLWRVESCSWVFEFRPNWTANLLTKAKRPWRKLHFIL